MQRDIDSWRYISLTHFCEILLKRPPGLRTEDRRSSTAGGVDTAFVADRDEFERISAAASQHVFTRFRFDRHVDEVMGVINRFASERTAHDGLEAQ